MSNAVKIVEMVQDAGGKVVGRTRLQKMAYLLTVTGFESGLEFKYKHYGPFSEDVAAAARDGKLLGLMMEEEKPTSWGGSYSIYSAPDAVRATAPDGRIKLAKMAACADAIELELAATAVFLAKQGHPDAWEETARRKPEKAEAGRIDRAKGLFRQISEIAFPIPLPAI